MITIEKTNNKGFHIVITGENNEVLNSSENLKSRAACFKNILATARNIGGATYVRFYDNSTGKKKPVLYHWQIKINDTNIKTTPHIITDEKYKLNTFSKKGDTLHNVIDEN